MKIVNVPAKCECCQFQVALQFKIVTIRNNEGRTETGKKFKKYSIQQRVTDQLRKPTNAGL